MVLDATTDSLEIVLDKAITTNQLSFTVFYNEYTSTSVTPMSLYSATNSTTAVNLISAPASGRQRQLRYCSINNVDTADIGVKIRFNDNGTYRNVLYVLLKINESIQYSEEMGWRVYNASGDEKISGYFRIPNSLRMPEYFGAANIATSLTATNDVGYCVFLGKVERPFSSVKVQYKTTTAMSGVGAWAEIGIYKGNPVLSGSTSYTRLGYADVTSTVTATAGVKTSTVTITNSMAIGDEIWAVFTSNATTAPVLRAGLADNLGAGFHQTVSSFRPSTNSTFNGTVDSTTAIIWWAWQGIYQGT